MNSGTWVLTVIAAASISAMPMASAHPGHEHDGAPPASRTWTLADTGAHLHGTFVAARDGRVQVRRDDGQLVSLTITQLSPEDQRWISNKLAEIRRLNEQLPPDSLLAAAPAAPITSTRDPAAQLAKAFEPFASRKAVAYRSDDRFFYVESNGLPDHPMMIGITAWQQQVPLPQKYTGNNAWRIPLVPVPAREPLSAKSHFFRGAIALAVNGVPIFNPIKNDGRTDTLLAGELDEYGGHCGRADDYHYHVAPVHLEKHVGKGSVIAYALDGYPIYGYEEADGSKVQGLDWLNGHQDGDGHYHYHATKTYPYLNGGFYGEVVERDGQVDPQPYAQGVREALPPLPGAKILAFTATAPQSYMLTYVLGGRQGHVNYTIAQNGSVVFRFTDTNGRSTEETYQPGRRPPLGGDQAGEKRPPSRKEASPPEQAKGKAKGGKRQQGKEKRPAPDTTRATTTRDAASAETRPKGPGIKTYHITIYALSEELSLAPEKATRANLLAAIKNMTLAQGTLDFRYERQGAN